MSSGSEEDLLRRLVAEAVQLEFKALGRGGFGRSRGGGGGGEGWFSRLLGKVKDRIKSSISDIPSRGDSDGSSSSRGSSRGRGNKRSSEVVRIDPRDFADSHDDLADHLGEDPTIGEFAAALRVSPASIKAHVSRDSGWELRGTGLDATVHKVAKKRGK